MATPRKKPEELLKRGRPTLYRPEYCEQVVEMGRAGKSFAQMASRFDVARATIDLWAQEFPEFMEALARAKTHSQSWWEDRGQDELGNKSFNANQWTVSVRARFREDYTERKELSGPNGGPVQITNKLDVSGLDDDQLDALEAALTTTLKNP